MDAQRAMLDEMMGMNRNLDNPDAEIQDYRDERVCKHFLLGCCPHDVFSKTKIDLGQCEGMHDEALQERFQADVKKEEEEEGGRERRRGHVSRDRDAYERELEAVLREYIHEADKKIARGRKRTDVSSGADAPAQQEAPPRAQDRDPPPPSTARGPGNGVGIGTLGGGGGGREGGREEDRWTCPPTRCFCGWRRRSQRRWRRRKRREEGEVEEAMKLNEKAEALQQEREETQKELLAGTGTQGEREGRREGRRRHGDRGPGVGHPPDRAFHNNGSCPSSPSSPAPPPPPTAIPSSADPNARLRVCDVCGAFLSITDNDKRLADHFWWETAPGLRPFAGETEGDPGAENEAGKEGGREGGREGGQERAEFEPRAGAGAGTSVGPESKQEPEPGSRTGGREGGREGGGRDYGREFGKDRDRDRYGGRDEHYGRGRERRSRSRSRSRSRERGGRRY
ncbi:hypothetical protein NSK_004627 [Nannochloropsis salina CCMP1776]|uniref:Uncharacterized protein n=1 Tax=Nannochloropsis salina CCMP1776 TaxID=1027361 RepID=A0A4D9D3Z1_9STRA|nr:hypothetical protein NSK_004627 [Nannochloropsis salina CCMP1776]|eukprot:TFJ84155.1 hypothetical protein NSK_004627 [Nannochloropsis salina CCMP1776]